MVQRLTFFWLLHADRLGMDCQPICGEGTNMSELLGVPYLGGDAGLCQSLPCNHAGFGCSFQGRDGARDEKS
jgi:hypothetical protein